jgi:hypothetical protein
MSRDNPDCSITIPGHPDEPGSKWVAYLGVDPHPSTLRLDIGRCTTANPEIIWNARLRKPDYNGEITVVVESDETTLFFDGGIITAQLMGVRRLLSGGRSTATPQSKS